MLLLHRDLSPDKLRKPGQQDFPLNSAVHGNRQDVGRPAHPAPETTAVLGKLHFLLKVTPGPHSDHTAASSPG